VQAGLEEENARWKNRGKLSVKIDQVGVRPAGQTADDAPIVKAAVDAIKALNLGEPKLSASSSDSNVPMHLGIPSITIGGGGMDKGAHSLGETDDVTDSYKGPQNALLLILSLLQ
jgi:tripeptide aminopeptidase